MGDLIATPGQTVGPFFHDALVFDKSNELVPPGTEAAIRLHGTVYDGAGEPVQDALIEIRQAGGRFGGWGRSATDSDGRYEFTTVEPPTFFSVVVFARGLLNRLFTRAYVPVPELEANPTMIAVRERDGSLRFDIHLQGDRETVILTFPGHGER